METTAGMLVSLDNNVVAAFNRLHRVDLAGNKKPSR